ncbi:MAG TPA: acetate/propionate family kinase [Rhizomicrobium sp.]|nr:acetate/propionate family kinase [Rhizomicrobium sp.]
MAVLNKYPGISGGTVAVINAGSSSIKFALYNGEQYQSLMFRGQVEQIGVSPRLRVVDAEKQLVTERHWRPQDLDHRAASQEILETAAELLNGRAVVGIGHRVVHGGMSYSSPVRIDDKVMAALAALAPLAPLHQPHNLSPIAVITERAPQIPQVACFDTAFHRTQANLAQLFAIPRKFTEAGMRRYGFHGLSYEYVVSQLGGIAPELAAARIVIAHLGNGASLCAVHQGRSVASTMGFTAVDGLMMGTRCGAIDPGAILYLMDSYGMDARAIENLVYRQSGLLGVSGISSDMRTLHASSNPAAAEAIALFAYRIVREIGSLAAALGGIDALIFTGGIGENDPAVRAQVCEGCRWLGLELDDLRNKNSATRISTETSRVTAWVVPTDEERMVARHAVSVLQLRSMSQ